MFNLNCKKVFMLLNFKISKLVFIVLFFVLFSFPFLTFSATIISTEVGGDWTENSTWIGGVVPIGIDDVVIDGDVNMDGGSFSTITKVNLITINIDKTLAGEVLETKEMLNNGTVQNQILLENKIENNGVMDETIILVGDNDHVIEIIGTNNVDIAFRDGLDNIVLVGGDNINDISLHGGLPKKITFQNQKTLWEVNEIAGTPGELTIENLDKLKLKSLERTVLHSLNTEIEFWGGGKIGSFVEAENIILESGSYECVPYGDVQYKVDNILVKSGVIFSSPNSIGSPPSPCIFTSEFENQGELKGFTAEMRGKFINNGIITKKETTDFEKISTKGEFINNGTLIPDRYNNHPVIDIYKSLENNSVVSDDLFFNIKSNGTEVEPVIIKGSIKPNINLSSEYDTYFLNGENNNLNFKKLRSYGDKFLNIPNQFNVFIEKLIAINDKIIFLNENNIELNGFDINTNDIEALNSNLTIRGGIFNGFEKEIKAKNIILENGNYSCGVLEASEDIMIKDSANITAGCSFKAQNLYNEGGFTGGQTSPETIDIDAFFVNSGIITGEYTSKLIINFYKDVFNVGTINTDTYSNINIYGNIENDSEFYIKNLNLFNESINIIGDVLIDGRIFLKQDTIFQEDIREIKAEIIDNGFSFAFLSSYIKINKLSNYSTIDKKILDLRFFSNLNIPNSDVIISHEVGQASYILGINNLKKLEVKNNVSISSNTEINAEIIKIHNDGNNSYIGSDVIFNTKIINEGIMNSSVTYGGNSFYFKNHFQNIGTIENNLYAKFKFPDDVNIYEYKVPRGEVIYESTNTPIFSFNTYLNDTETPEIFHYRLKGDMEWIEVKINYPLEFIEIEIPVEEDVLEMSFLEILNHVEGEEIEITITGNRNFEEEDSLYNAETEELNFYLALNTNIGVNIYPEVVSISLGENEIKTTIRINKADNDVKIYIKDNGGNVLGESNVFNVEEKPDTGILFLRLDFSKQQEISEDLTVIFKVEAFDTKVILDGREYLHDDLEFDNWWSLKKKIETTSCDRLVDLGVETDIKVTKKTITTAIDPFTGFEIVTSETETIWKHINTESYSVFIPCNKAVTQIVEVVEDLTVSCLGEGKVPVLLVPGILGSSEYNIFRYEGAYPWLPKESPVWNSGKLELHDAYKKVGWKKIKKSFEEMGYKRGCNIIDVPYDWSLSIPLIRDQYLKPWIEEAKRRTGMDKVDIVAHSMGGLVVRSYVQSDSYQDDIRNFAMVGTPNEGSVNAYFIYNGDLLLADILNDNIQGTDIPFTGITERVGKYFYTQTIENLNEVRGSGQKLCLDISGGYYNKRLKKVLEKVCDLEKTADFVRKNSKSLFELTPTFSFLKNKYLLENNLKKMDDKNNFLESLNNGGMYKNETYFLPSDIKNQVNDLKIFGGNVPSSTVREVLVMSRLQTLGDIWDNIKNSNIVYQDGIPGKLWFFNSKDLVKYDKGDGTVSESSLLLGEIFKDSTNEITHNGTDDDYEHGFLIRLFLDQITNYITS